MNSGEHTYIWQADDWPKWQYDLAALAGRSYARALQLDAGNALLASKLATLRQWLGPPSPAR